MAQDLAATIGLGDNDRTINMVDANGVVMVSIQALSPAGSCPSRGASVAGRQNRSGELGAVAA